MFNPNDTCMANRATLGCQHTVLFHMDDLKSSQKNMKLDYSEKGKIKIGMLDHVKNMIEEFSQS